MIKIYIKAGIVSDKSVLAVVLKSQKHRWLKTSILPNMTKKQIESFSIICALSHMGKKHRKKKITIYMDSDYITSMIHKDKCGNYTKNTSVYMTKLMRDIMDEYGSLSISPTPNNDDMEELVHVYKECGLDGIELDEKD